MHLPRLQMKVLSSKIFSYKFQEYPFNFHHNFTSTLTPINFGKPANKPLLQLTITLQPVADASEVHLRRDDCIKHDSNPQGDLRGR